MGRRALVAAAAALAAGGGAGSAALAADAGAVLSLAGRIAPAISYRVRIDYTTTVNDRACQFSDYITGMWDPQTESRYEAPAIHGDRHHLKVALEHPGGPGACGWRPTVISLCVAPRGRQPAQAACRALFLLRTDADAGPAALALSCDLKALICLDHDGRDPSRQVSALPDPVALDLAATPG